MISVCRHVADKLVLAGHVRSSGWRLEEATYLAPSDRLSRLGKPSTGEPGGRPEAAERGVLSTSHHVHPILPYKLLMVKVLCSVLHCEVIAKCSKIGTRVPEDGWGWSGSNRVGCGAECENVRVRMF